MLQQTQSATAIRLRKASTGINPRLEHRIFASRGQIRAGNAKFLRYGGNSALGRQNSCVTGANPRWEHRISASRGQIRAGNAKFLRHGGISFWFSLRDARISAGRYFFSRQCENQRQWYYALMDYGADLKKRGENPSRRNATYTKQSAFSGSVRQARGAIIRQLSAGVATIAEIAEREHIDTARLEVAAKAIACRTSYSRRRRWLFACVTGTKKRYTLKNNGIIIRLFYGKSQSWSTVCFCLLKKCLILYILPFSISYCFCIKRKFIALCFVCA